MKQLYILAIVAVGLLSGMAVNSTFAIEYHGLIDGALQPLNSTYCKLVDEQFRDVNNMVNVTAAVLVFENQSFQPVYHAQGFYNATAGTVVRSFPSKVNDFFTFCLTLSFVVVVLRFK